MAFLLMHEEVASYKEKKISNSRLDGKNHTLFEIKMAKINTQNG